MDTTAATIMATIPRDAGLMKRITSATTEPMVAETSGRYPIPNTWSSKSAGSHAAAMTPAIMISAIVSNSCPIFVFSHVV